MAVLDMFIKIMIYFNWIILKRGVLKLPLWYGVCRMVA